jgi:hypothetical protein
MILRGLALIAVLLAAPQAPKSAASGTRVGSSARPQSAPAAASPSAPSAAASPAGSAPAAANQAPGAEGDDGNGALPTPHITIATPAPAPAPWPLQDRIAWGADVLLAIVGYVGVMLAISTLRKIERQTRYGEAAAQAAAESAQAALLLTQAMARAERPWILATVERSPTIENGFVVVATNRGRSPARVESITDTITTAADKQHLPPDPKYGQPDPQFPAGSIILLPGESIRIKFFSRGDVRVVFGEGRKFEDIESWKERIFLYGRIVYTDLAAPGEKEQHETLWCCWYIHGRQKSAMVVSGPPAYIQHT